MTAGVDLERRLADWFVDDAPGRAPDRVLLGAMERVDAVGQRRGVGRSITWRWAGLSRRQRLAITLLATIALLITAVAGAMLLVPREPAAPSLIVVRSTDPTVASPVDVLELAADGTETALVHLGLDVLPGGWAGAVSLSSDGWLGLLTQADPDPAMVIVDLRDPAAPLRHLDGTWYSPSWSPGGERLASQAGEEVVVYDLTTGTTASFAMPVDTFLQPNGSAPLWTDVGTTFVGAAGPAFGDDSAPGGTRPAPLGAIGMDGVFVPGVQPAVYSGIGPRRVRPDGTFLRCRPEEDDSCIPDDATLYAVGDTVEAVWSEADPTMRVSDHAWAADGGLWVLMETQGAGPRTVTLVRVSPDGTESVATTAQAGADDPDPNSYCQGGRFLAMAPDDSRVVIATTGDACSNGSSYLVDTATGTQQVLQGEPAGWLTEADRSAPRPAIAPIIEGPSAMVGDWAHLGDGAADPTVALEAGRSTLGITVDGAPAVSLAMGADGADQVTFRQAADALGCVAGTSATYRWATDAGGLTLTAVDEACPERGQLLGRMFEPALPDRGNGEPAVPAGIRYVVPSLGLRLTIPSGPDSYVWQRDDARVALGRDDTHWQLTRADQGVSAWCGEYTTVPIGPGVDGMIAYVESLADDGVRLDQPTETTVAGRRAVRGVLRVDTACASDRQSLISNDSGGFSVGDGASLIIIDGAPGGPAWLIDAGTGEGGGGDTPWADELTASLEFAGLD